ncbi:MAG: PQQ-binding-like beta-propeller repeat protein, partial [Planctomycetota bacterium]|nr:PQQ-binding-like beta-propeller repeat protein [Planctomycetota bacterium]
AANPSGLYVYLNYADHRAELDRRLGGAQGQARSKVLLDRGKLACTGGRFDEALADLKAVLEQPGQAEALADGAREWQMRTYVARGDRRENPGEMVGDFQRAYDVAGTPARQAQMLVRLAKAQRAQAAGTPAADEAGKLECLRLAVQAAHRLADTLGGQKVADVPVGAASASQPPELLPLTDARAWAMATFLPALLKENGRACYGAWDAQADAALAGALAGDDVAAMLAVRDRWPNSMHVPRALIAAAQSIYRRQTPAPPATAPKGERAYGLITDSESQELDRAYGLLADVEDGADPRTAVTSLTGRAMIAARRATDSPLLWILAQQIREVCAEGKIPLTEPVAFNQVDKPLQTFLEELGGPDQASAAAPPEPALTAPLEPAFTLKGDYYLVRDQACQSVRQGAVVLAVREDRLIWLDTAAPAADKALRWDVKTPLNSREVRNYMLGAPGFSLVGALGGEGKSILVCDRTWAMALNVADGKGLWKAPVNVMTLTGGAVHSMGLADGRLVVLDHAGRARCLDGADGKVLWTTDLSADLGRFGAPPQVAGGLVLLQSDGAQKVACLDLRTGKSRALWSSNQYVSARVLPCGLMAVLGDGVCSLYSLAGSTPLARPIWTRKYNSDNMNAPTLDVIRLDNKPLPAVKLTNGRQGGVCAVHPAGEFLYLAVGRNVNGSRAGLYLGQMVISPMALYRVEAATGREVWKNVAPLVNGPSSASFPIVQAGQTVTATAGGPTFGTSLSVMLLGASDGRRLQTIELAGPIQGAAGIKAQEDMARRRSLGPAQVVAGRLCAEDVGGITVYRPKDVPPPAKP